MSAQALDVESMGAFIWASTPGTIDQLLHDIDRELLMYLSRYASLSVREMEGMTLSRLRRFADGIHKIIKAENAT